MASLTISDLSMGGDEESKLTNHTVEDDNAEHYLDLFKGESCLLQAYEDSFKVGVEQLSR